MSADGKPSHGRTRIVSDSARKRNRKEVLANYNKTRINIGPQHNLDGIEGSFESTNSYWGVKISAIAHVVWILGHEKWTILGDKLQTKNNENIRFIFMFGGKY